MSNKKLILNIVAVIVIIGLLAGAVWFLSKPERGEAPVQEQNDEIEVYSVPASDIVAADVTNKYGSYTLTRTDGGWSLGGFEGITLDVNMLDNLTDTFSKVEATQLIDENPEKAGDYGLANPETVLKLTTAGGGRTFSIGKETPDGGGYYFSTDASPAVYVMESYVADVAFLTARDYVNLGDSFAADSVTRVRIAPRGGSALCVEKDPEGERDRYGLLSYWNITEPQERSASNSDVLTLLTTPAADLESTASGIYENTAENRALTGVDAPEFNIEVTADGKNIAYAVSPASDEYRYLLREDSGYILRVDAEAADFAYTAMDAVAERYLAVIDIADVSGLEVDFRGEKTEFTVVDGAGDNAAFYRDSEELEADDFRALYQKLVALPVSGVLDDAPAEGVFGSITYKLASGENYVLEFAPYSERGYGVYINGRRQYSMLKKNVDDLFDLVREF